MDLIIAQIVAALSAGGLVVLVLRHFYQKRPHGPTTPLAAPQTTADQFSGGVLPVAGPAKPLGERLKQLVKVLGKGANALKRFAANQAWPKVKTWSSAARKAIVVGGRKSGQYMRETYAKAMPKVKHGAEAAQLLTQKSGRDLAALVKRGWQATQDQWQELYDSIQHLRMRQKEHRERLKERRHFLGDLATKVDESRERPVVDSFKLAPLESETPAAKTPTAVIKPPMPRESEPMPQPAVAQSEAENQARMERILREQERILIQEIVKKPKDIALYKRLGFVYLELGEAADARECFEQAVRLGSQDPLIRLELKKLATTN